ncbi:MAG: large conductance mechanosensitive channel protein MscL [Anaerolineaceae bacterium]|nr:large conductance mechanosensitive channel protein MscL [Anaerolineaceae bacterium]
MSKAKGFLQEFKDFALKGNVIDLAIAFIMGGSFGTIINSIVNDIIMPPVGLLLGGVDFSNLFIMLKPGDPAGPYLLLAEAQEAGAVTINYGVFLSTIITFIIISLIMFLIIKSMNSMEKEKAPAKPTTKECPHCCTDISIKATRCPNCTSMLEE